MTNSRKGKGPPTAFLLGVLLTLIPSLMLLGGACDATEITCERDEDRVDCVLVTSLTGWERSRVEIPDVVSATYDYDQPSRADLVFAHTGAAERVYLETTEEDVSRELDAFISDPSRERYHHASTPPAPILLGLVGLGVLLVFLGAFQWLARRRSGGEP